MKKSRTKSVSFKLKSYFFLLVVFLPLYLLRLYSSLSFSFKEGDRVRILSLLKQEPVIKGRWQYFKIKGILVKTEAKPSYHYGDKLEIVGIVKKQESRTFFTQFELVDLQIKKEEKSRNLLKNLFLFRQRLEREIRAVLGEPQASLLAGIFLGSKDFEGDFYQALQTSGTLHIMVASGMNIALLAGVLVDSLSRFLKRKRALLVSLGVVFFYCLMAGMEPPVVRAGIMAGVLYLSHFLGRETTGFWSLLLTGIVMLVFKPLLLGDLGFQLSFMATAGLIVLTPFLKKKLERIPLLAWGGGEISDGLGAMVFTLPILVISFGHFNPLSIVPNLLIGPLVPYLLYLGLLIGVLGMVWSFLGRVLGVLAWLPLSLIVLVIRFFGQLTAFDLRLEGLSWIFGLGYYLILFVILRRRNEF